MKGRIWQRANARGDNNPRVKLDSRRKRLHNFPLLAQSHLSQSNTDLKPTEELEWFVDLMDADDLRSILRESCVDIWTLIDTAISVASIDHRNEIRRRRDGIVERLYAPVPPVLTLERRSSTEIIKEEEEEKKTSNNNRVGKVVAASFSSPYTPQSIDGNEEEDGEEEEDEDDQVKDGIYENPMIDDEQIKILGIKEHLEDPHQSDDALVNLLQDLADMDITFKALQDTDIGRHVNRLRKHSSGEVRRLVKILVRKWKDLVDEWVKSENGTSGSTFIVDGDSPQPRSSQHSINQVPDFAYSPNLHNGSSGSDKNSEPEPKPKVIRRDLPMKQTQSAPREQKSAVIDPDKFASARRRLHENYQEAQNAKKQRKIQVMDLHDIPKPKSNSFFGRNKGGFQAKHW